MILCLEGPSAVGKTTTARALQERLRAALIPEVNALFERPLVEPQDWYLDRQTERWNIARQASATHPLAVLDGDPFQPLWYNWSFGFQGRQSLEYLHSFFRPLIAGGALSFPDLYVHLVVGQDELRRRKENDMTRTRRNFERHLRLLDTQRRYFSVMAALVPSLVLTVEAASLDENVRLIQAAVERCQEDTYDRLALFESLISWVSDHPATE